MPIRPVVLDSDYGTVILPKTHVQVHAPVTWNGNVLFACAKDVVQQGEDFDLQP